VGSGVDLAPEQTEEEKPDLILQLGSLHRSLTLRDRKELARNELIHRQGNISDNALAALVGLSDKTVKAVRDEPRRCRVRREARELGGELSLTPPGDETPPVNEHFRITHAERRQSMFVVVSGGSPSSRRSSAPSLASRPQRNTLRA
jgi:hypothetical protein